MMYRPPRTWRLVHGCRDCFQYRRSIELPRNFFMSVCCFFSVNEIHATTHLRTYHVCFRLYFVWIMMRHFRIPQHKLIQCLWKNFKLDLKSWRWYITACFAQMIFLFRHEDKSASHCGTRHNHLMKCQYTCLKDDSFQRRFHDSVAQAQIPGEKGKRLGQLFILDHAGRQQCFYFRAAILNWV